ncbi:MULTISPECIES: DNA-3-methyladenine glycosylase [Anaerolinea]|uniref:DNA-3-methyladenine glycosylase n=1 Tax=Anaerolinea TaxID=233189 RepID=UPI002620C926|nr:DNA-3-methyladenine glycosylase [Anaerolinea thermophila]
MSDQALPVEFYDRNTLDVAHSLLGMRLIRKFDSIRLVGVITETEAYRGEEDLACHARAGLTPRTQVMYGRAGHAYVYFTYGMHWLLNVVTEKEGFPAAVLIRAVRIVEGEAWVRERRKGVPPRNWTDGPAKLCRAFDIDGSLNGADLTVTDNGLWIAQGQTIPEEFVERTPRIGINSVPEPWRSIPWRFRVRDEFMV